MRLLAFTLLLPVLAVKQEEFKVCQQSSFCVRQRAFADLADLKAVKAYTVAPASVSFEKGVLHFDVVNEKTKKTFASSLEFLEKDLLRVRMNEKSPVHPRYDGTQEIAFGTKLQRASNVQEKKTDASAVFVHGDNEITLHFSPLTLTVKNKGDTVLSFNERNYLHYEHYRAQGEVVEYVDAASPEAQQLVQSLNHEPWAETFKDKPDTKPRGPSSIGIDVTLVGFEHTYGLPEHASNFTLEPTRGNGKKFSEPYRLYNLDVFEYILDSPMALYGAVPFVLGHRKGKSVGFLYVNAAEMWIDVEKVSSHGKPSTGFHWATESGLLDFIVITGSGPLEIQNKLTYLSGRPALPQYFAVAYHQCRWNYNDEEDVADVDKRFDENYIPYDVLWLDIEHTDGKKYFTWNSNKFPSPRDMQDNLAKKGRKMVTIIDPHLKADDGYHVARQAKAADLMVKTKDKGVFEGWCWPGASNWLDYLNPSAREFWSKQYLYENYIGSTPNLYTWNDMNEPSVFTGPEITMPKDNLHYGDVEHRDIHNFYGMLQHRASYEGHLLRSQNKDRPFILSRSFFIGTQRYGAIWTGDNFAHWDHLGASVPMLLSLGVSGVTFVGADVGGFFGNPVPELLVRWYQVGAFQPFFRAHAHIDSKRREPWLFGDANTKLIRDAIVQRYRNLPYVYTLFFESNQTGSPVMRPMFYEFPEDENTFSIDTQYMFGAAYLVKPITGPGVTTATVYLPKGTWYDYHTHNTVEADEKGYARMSAPLSRTPVLIRGGQIIPRKERLRRSSSLMRFDPYTLVIALHNGEAKGTLYVDDGKSYAHEHGKFIIADFEYANGQLKATIKPRDGLLKDKVEELKQRVERIVILGEKDGYTKAKTSTGKECVVKSKDLSGSVKYVIKDPAVIVGESWTVSLL